MSSALMNPFFATRARTVALARQRYFDDGISPAGAVSDAVFQSWMRCQRLHDGPGRRVEFQPVTQSRVQLALQRNRGLLQAWQAEVSNLEDLLGQTSCAAMLTDGTGVMVGSTCAGRPHERLMPVAARVGVNLSEEAVGTTAPGIVVRTGQPVCVLGSEHYFDHVRQMHCAAAPIHDAQGCLAGVLDLSSESIEFGFDAAAMVGYLASTIENRMLVAQSADQLILRIQLAPSLLESSTVGLIGIRQDGMVAWVNGIASRLLGLTGTARGQAGEPAEALLGYSFKHLAAKSRLGAAMLTLPSGLSLWARAEMPPQAHAHVPTPVVACHTTPGAAAARLAAPDRLTAATATVEADPLPAQSGATPEPIAPQASAALTVRTSHQELLQRALQESAGNVSQAARKLGVSRGWIYRRMLDTVQDG